MSTRYSGMVNKKEDGERWTHKRRMWYTVKDSFYRAQARDFEEVIGYDKSNCS